MNLGWLDCLPALPHRHAGCERLRTNQHDAFSCGALVLSRLKLRYEGAVEAPRALLRPPRFPGSARPPPALRPPCQMSVEAFREALRGIAVAIVRNVTRYEWWSSSSIWRHWSSSVMSISSAQSAWATVVMLPTAHRPCVLVSSISPASEKYSSGLHPQHSTASLTSCLANSSMYFQSVAAILVTAHALMAAFDMMSSLREPRSTRAIPQQKN